MKISRCLVSLLVHVILLHQSGADIYFYQKFEVMENVFVGTRIGQVYATSRPETELVFSIDTKDFVIEAATGVIRVRVHLDYEARRLYEVKVTAEDVNKTQAAAHVLVQVHVLDVNDHKPEIIINSLAPGGGVEVLENSPPGTFVTHILVNDPDSPEVTCASSQPEFNLVKLFKGEYKLVTAVALDREMRSSYEVTIRCTDPVYFTDKVINVKVKDVNDNSPMFMRRKYSVEVSHVAPAGTLIIQVSATDQDTGRNADIRYSLSSGADVATVDAMTGLVRITTKLDPEQQQQHTLVVQATDQGEPPLRARADVIINVI